RIAGLKYEEAHVKAQKGATSEAERLYTEAVTSWEEVLTQASSPEYRKVTTMQLAEVWLLIAQLRLRENKPRDAEAALVKSIQYGERAVKLAPDRPLVQDKLEVARNQLDRLREQAHLDEINRAMAAERYAEALDLSVRGVEELEEQLRTGVDRDAAKRRLAHRLERLAWLLAHCPDGRGRDAKQAVKRARQAVDFPPDARQYWYTP